MPEVVEHRKFICVAFGETNNNKYWNITLFDDDDVYVEWGRVGKKAQSKTHYSAGRRKYDSLIKSKTKESNAPDKRYTENKAVGGRTVKAETVSSANLKEIAKKQIKTTSTVVEQLIDDLVRENAHNILQATGGSITYDESNATFTTPQGVIVPEQVQEARDALIAIADHVHKEDYDSEFDRHVETYLRLIPHAVGMKRIVPMEMFPNLTVVQKENDILDGLDTSFADIMYQAKDNKGKDVKVDEPQVFDVQLEWLDDDKEVRRIKKKYRDTRKDGHVCKHLDVKNIYTVCISSMKNKFDAVKDKIGNVMELWHGSSTANLLSILKSGLKTSPPNTARITGKMFGGNSIYFASDSTKSLNYSYGYWSGQRQSKCFMFTALVAMGKSYTPKRTWESLPKRGYDSTWAKSGVSGIRNDEMVIYDDNQCNLTSLIEFG